MKKVKFLSLLLVLITSGSLIGCDTTTETSSSASVSISSSESTSSSQSTAKELTTEEKIENSLGNIKFSGEAYKELYDDEGKLGTTLKGPMMSLFTENSYHWEAKGEFDDFDGGESSLWYVDGKTTIYQYTLDNQVVASQATYDDGTPVDWEDFSTPINLLINQDLTENEDNKVVFDLSNADGMTLACDIVERVAWWQFDTLESLVISFDDTRIANITFRTTMTNDNWQDCVYGASLDVVAFGENCPDYPKPEPYELTPEKEVLDIALKEMDESNYILSYQEQLMTYTTGKVYKTDDTFIYIDDLDNKYTMGVTKIDGECYYIGFDYETEQLSRSSESITYTDSNQAVPFEELIAEFSAVSAAFFETSDKDANLFTLEDEPAMYFGQYITYVAGAAYDLTPMTSELTEVYLSEDKELDHIVFNTYGMEAANLQVDQIGGEITLPIDIANLPVASTL